MEYECGIPIEVITTIFTCFLLCLVGLWCEWCDYCKLEEYYNSFTIESDVIGDNSFAVTGNNNNVTVNYNVYMTGGE